MEFIRPRTKVHPLDEGYAWVSKTWDFVKDSIEEFGKSKVLSLGSVHKTSQSLFYAQRGKDSSYFGLFLLFVDYKSDLRVVWHKFHPYGAVWVEKSVFIAP